MNSTCYNILNNFVTTHTTCSINKVELAKCNIYTHTTHTNTIPHTIQSQMTWPLLIPLNEHLQFLYMLSSHIIHSYTIHSIIQSTDIPFNPLTYHSIYWHTIQFIDIPSNSLIHHPIHWYTIQSIKKQSNPLTNHPIHTPSIPVAYRSKSHTIYSIILSTDIYYSPRTRYPGTDNPFKELPPQPHTCWLASYWVLSMCLWLGCNIPWSWVSPVGCAC